MTCLKVGEHTILEARKHADIYGPGAPPLSKPIITRVRLNEEQLKQFELFFNDKANVNMSSYKTETKTGLPVLYRILRALCGGNFMKISK